jgi:hypothetical protein
MGSPIKFEGATHDYGPPKGREDSVGRLHCFKNGVCVVSAWQLDEKELKEILETGKIFLSIMSGDVVFPCYVGSESSTASVVVDHGRVWR